MSKHSPVIGRTPAEIHAQAASLGFIAETYSEIVAGHGPTGRVGWAVSFVHQSGVWTDAIRMRYGTASSHEHARAALRDALAELSKLQRDTSGRAVIAGNGDRR